MIMKICSEHDEYKKYIEEMGAGKLISTEEKNES